VNAGDAVGVDVVWEEEGGREGERGGLVWELGRRFCGSGELDA